MEEYRDTHGHFVAKEDSGEKCPHDRWETARSEAKKAVEEHSKKAREYWDAHSYVREKDGKRMLDRSKLDEAKLNYERATDSNNQVFRKLIFSPRPGDDYDYGIYHVFNPAEGKEYFQKGHYSIDNRYEDLNELLDQEFRSIEYEEGAAAREKEEARKKAEFEERKKNAKDESGELLRMTDEQIEGRYSDDPITQGAQIGGYIGRSMSKSAAYSEASGSMPMSKWTKKALMGYIMQDESMFGLRKRLESLPLSKLKDVTLYEDGWHHTGPLMKETTFYAVNSPQEIAKNLKAEMERQAKAAEKAASASREKKVFGV